MTISDEAKAELRRLHAAFTAADEQLARATLNANERRIRQEHADEAERWLAGMWIGHGLDVLDALAAAEAERDGLLAEIGRPYPDECPCENENPDPCPACGASVAKGSCMARKYRRAP